MPQSISTRAPHRFDDPDACAEATLRRLGKRIVLGLPVALGKPLEYVNALVGRAVRDPSIRLTILTGLSLRKPQGRSTLERRLLEPFVARLYAGIPDLEYVRLLERNALPANIDVTEFFLSPGAWLDNPYVQQHYLSSNYTHVIRDGLRRGLNVLAQLVAPADGHHSGQLSLSCNTDLAVDLLPHIAAARADNKPFLLVGQLHPDLPYMYGDALIPEESFDFLIDSPQHRSPLFSVPNLPIEPVDHMIGLQVSALIKDGGTLQLGIGELGDAIVYSLVLRQQQPATYREVLEQTQLLARSGALIESEGGTASFDRGLYACTEMLVDGFLDLYRSGILKRRVYPSARVQQLLNAGLIEERLDGSFVEALHESGIRRLSYVDFQEMRDIGVFREEVRYESGMLVAPDGSTIPVYLDDPASRKAIAERCLGSELRGGVLLDAGFFVGPKRFYQALRELPTAERELFAMRGISFVNELHGPEMELKLAQRHQARFVNSTLMVTGLGAAVSDGLADGRVVSGVGGQYNFVAMAHALPDARSILCLRSTRIHGGRTQSNILWNYGHATIPRHLRDIVVTEYGIADLRGKTDAEVADALIAIMDARFQEEFVADARRAGKLPANYRVSTQARTNVPERITTQLNLLRDKDLFGSHPFGTDFTPDEVALAKALKWLGREAGSLRGRARLLGDMLLVPAVNGEVRRQLDRMGLVQPHGLRERVLERLVRVALHAEEQTRAPQV